LIPILGRPLIPILGRPLILILGGPLIPILGRVVALPDERHNSDSETTRAPNDQ